MRATSKVGKPDGDNILKTAVLEGPSSFRSVQDPFVANLKAIRGGEAMWSRGMCYGFSPNPFVLKG